METETQATAEIKNNCGHSESRAHDCRYVDHRNRLIPRAEQLAQERMRAACLDPGSGAFNRFFLAAMTELAVDAGLQDAPRRN